jgi:putative radical SAM enzyme (TIGR03279 family)
MIAIISIEKGSIAQKTGIKPGDTIIKINDYDINDKLDYRFYSNDENIEILVKREDEYIIFDIEKEYDENIGLELQELKLKACGNNCIFCFVYQNPRGMRKEVYFKDEDYRFSFLYGHYVTLTTVNKKDLERIVSQRLSPLYISVHATEKETRKLLLGNRQDDHLLEKIEYLVRGGIELHAQIVLCPGINDGQIFDQTVADLRQFYPGLKSLAIVPVGLTRHRSKLYPLRLHTRPELTAIIEYTGQMRKRLRQELDTWFIYLADEFFIKAGRPIPEHDYYDEFYQIENGVGEFRQMIDEFSRIYPGLKKQTPGPLQITWVTGVLAAETLEKYIITRLRKIDQLKIDLIAIENEFYGNSITVSGLLAGQDINKQLKDRQPEGGIVLLPPRVLNLEGFFLDNWTVAQLEKSLGKPCHVFQEPLSELFQVARRITGKE